ncbi:MAG: primosomal protein N', partial [Parabacteroides sp.]|nr:primosomal protein N' [Parabacteroides sp.]
MRYAEVILPLPLANSYTYRIPDELESLVVPGCRVMVYFGRKRSYTALVWEVHDRAPQAEQMVKELYALVDSSPVVRPLQLRFWQWIASYYICRLGDVYKAAIPSAQGFQPKRQLYVR